MLALLMLLAKHADLLVLLIEAIENHGVPKDSLVSQIKKLMTEASDAAIAKEFPNG